MDDRLYFLTKDNNGNEIFIKRDDLLPFSFGGNKVIIAKSQIEDMKAKKCDIMLGYGNSRSNLCRVLSNMCFAEKIPCKIISPLDDDDTFTPSYNNSFIKETNTEIITCKKSSAGETIAAVKKQCLESGLKPYFVYDAENIKAPVNSYANEYKNLSEDPDYVFLATGTGTTTAGLISGFIDKKLAGAKANTKFVGISVARTCERELPVISSYISSRGSIYEEYYAKYGKNIFTLCDNFVGKGYGSIESEVENVIKEVLLSYGIPLDPTYTGKAFYGMRKYIAENNITGKKIIFWHTGGLPLFFDYFKDR